MLYTNNTNLNQFLYIVILTFRLLWTLTLCVMYVMYVFDDIDRCNDTIAYVWLMILVEILGCKKHNTTIRDFLIIHCGYCKL